MESDWMSIFENNADENKYVTEFLVRMNVDYEPTTDNRNKSSCKRVLRKQPYK